MTFQDLYDRALEGRRLEVECLSLLFMLMQQGDDMPAGLMDKLEHLARELDLDLEPDQATWTPEVED